jgi:hypothetical protein
MSYYKCSKLDCNNVRRDRSAYCSPEHASAHRQQRYRERQNSGLTVVEMIATLSVGHTWEPKTPTAFGVPTTADVQDIFADDAIRYQQMGVTGGYGNRHRTPMSNRVKKLGTVQVDEAA